MEPPSGNTVDIDSPEFRTDEFRMYGLKVIDCARRYSHDWTTCPFAHPGEKARRRDPRKYNYAGVACPLIKQNNYCPLGDDCQYAHNVFEYWLHPTRYRTQLCNIAASCNRTVCFFAHTIEELRVPLPVGTDDAGGVLSAQLQAHQQQQRQNWNPFSHNASPMTDTSGAGGSANLAISGMTFDLQAKYIVQQLIASRQAELSASRSPTSDLSEIRLLIGLLQEQQAAAGVSDRNPDLQLMFLNALLQSLAREVNTIVQSAEKERLTKLVDWMYVQLVQNRQSLFSSTDSNLPFAPQPAEAQQAPPVPQWAEMFVSRQSLSRIPEMTEAAPSVVSLPAILRASHEGVYPYGRPISFATGLDPDPRRQIPGLRSASLDTGFMSLRSPGQSRHLRSSDESSGTRISANRTSGSFSLTRSSDDSETINRHSHQTVLSPDSSQMSWEDPNQTPEFIFHEYLSHRARAPQPPPPPPGSDA